MKNVRFLILMSLAMLSYDSFAKCQVRGPQELMNYVDPEGASTIAFDYERFYAGEIPAVYVDSCQDEARQRRLLMVANGPNYIGSSSDTIFSSYDGYLAPDRCIAQNYAGESMSFEDRQVRFATQKDVLDYCLTTVVKMYGQRSIALVENDWCEYERIDAKTVHVKGTGYCFFRIAPDSLFEITQKASDECLYDRSVQGDYFGHLNIFTVRDGSGRDLSLDPLDSTPFLLSFKPKSQLASSWVEQAPTWMSQYVYSEVEWARPSIRNMGRDLFISPKLLVDNRCQNTCNELVCQTSCLYAKPLYGEFNVYRKEGKSWGHIENSYLGDTIYPDWQGIITTESVYIPSQKLAVGDELKLEMIYRSPVEDFRLARQYGSSRELSLASIGLGRMNMSVGNSIPALGSISSQREIGKLDKIAPVAQSTKMPALNGRDIFESDENFLIWPSIYDDVCSVVDGSCMAIQDQKLMTLELTLKVTQALEGEELEYQVIEMKRMSNANILPEIQSDLASSLICE